MGGRADMQALLPAAMAHRLMWDQWVDVTGGKEKNGALDLTLELYIRYMEDLIVCLVNKEFSVDQEMSSGTRQQI